MNSISLIIILSSLSYIRPAILKNPKLLDKPSNIIIEMKAPLDSAFEEIESQSFNSRDEKATALQKALLEVTRPSQAPVLEVLDLNSVEYVAFWIVNEIFVKDAAPDLISVLFEKFSDKIEEIRDEVVEILTPLKSIVGDVPGLEEWNIRRIGAPEVWKKYDTRGEGKVVAIIDSGVRGSHEAIRGNYINRPEGFYDPDKQGPTEFKDIDGHGSHITGTIVGTNGIGVAPGAKWMACLGFTEGETESFSAATENKLKLCGQWALCPTNPTAYANPNRVCSSVPDIVNLSWELDVNGKNYYNGVIDAWNVANIIPVVAVGNRGPECSTTGSPGDQPNLISVGSTNDTDTVSTFSSRGPNKDYPNMVVPHMVAPGEFILSVDYSADDTYMKLRGTSMATPHVAGALALILSNTKEKMPLGKIKTLLAESAYRNLKTTGSKCGGVEEDKYPNSVAGYGRLDVLKLFDNMAEQGLI